MQNPVFSSSEDAKSRTYTAQIEINAEQKFRFLLVRFDDAVLNGNTPQVAAQWRKYYHQAMNEVLSPLSGLEITLRVVRQGDTAYRYVLLIGKDEQRPYLESLAAVFMRLNAYVAGTVSLTANRAAFDALCQVPEWYARIANPPGTRGSCPLMTPYLAAPHLTALLPGLPSSAEENLCLYQANLRRFVPTVTPQDRDLLLAGRLASSRAQESGLPQTIRQQQAKFANILQYETDYLIDEYIGASDAKVFADMQRRIGRDFCTTERRGIPDPEFETNEAAYLGLTSGLHCDFFAPHEPLESLNGAASHRAAATLLMWQIPAMWVNVRSEAVPDSASKTLMSGMERIEKSLRRIEEALAAQTARAKSVSDLYAPIDEVRRALGIYQHDAPFFPAKARQILEGLVNRLVQEVPSLQNQTNLTSNLNKRIELLEADRSLPGNIISYLQTLRIFGNKVIHPDATDGMAGRIKVLTDTDVEITLLMTLRLVEWYLLEFAPEVKP